MGATSKTRDVLSTVPSLRARNESLVMSNRWLVLTLLFVIRTAMAFQFGTVGALGPIVGQTFQVDAAGVGLLVGLYLAPGLIFALPGGAIGRYLGDKRAVLTGLTLMTLGGLISAFGTTWEEQLVGRVLAGGGGVVLNVLMSKMVTDWFDGREIATAMALFVNSWPAGIGIALLVQPHAANSGGVTGAFALTAVFAAIGFASLLLLYRQPKVTTGPAGGLLYGKTLACILLAGGMWGLFNASFAMIFAFGPILLTGRGWEIASASSATSIAVWLSALSVPIGGIVADWSKRPNLVIVIGLVFTAVAMASLPRASSMLSALVVAGLISGLPVGAIMALPARVLAPPNRALGMGLFFTVFYVFVFLGPPIAGALIDKTGWDGAAMDFGAFMLIIAAILLWVFERLAVSVESDEQI